MDLSDIFSFLGSLLALNQPKQKPQSYLEYGPIGTDPSTLNAALSQGIFNLFGGGVIGRLAALSVGDQFKDSGLFTNWMTSTLYPDKGTYSQAWQNRRTSQLLHMADLGSGYKDTLDILKRKFFLDYYRVTQPNKPSELYLQMAKDANWASIPSLFNAFLDPKNIQLTLRNIGLAAASAVNWLRRRMTANATDQIARTQAVTLAVGAAAALAALWDILMPGNRTNIRKYGGYSSSSVAQLGAALAALTDLAGATKAADVATLKKNITDTVSAIADALGPLRDVFKDDIPATVQAVRDSTGRSISSMTSALLSSFANNYVDVLRYTGAAPGLYQAHGKTIFEKLNGTYSNYQDSVHWAARQGVTGVTLNYMYMTSRGVAPGGMMQQIYAGTLQDRLVGSQSSLTADMMAKAYSVWKQNGGKGDAAEFRAMTNGSLLEAMKLAGVSNYALLNSGLNSMHYLLGHNSGQFADTGLILGYKLQLGTTFANLRGTGLDMDIALRLNSDLLNNVELAGKLSAAKDDALQMAILKDAGYSDGELNAARLIYNRVHQGLYGKDLKIAATARYLRQKSIEFKKQQNKLRQIFKDKDLNSSDTLSRIGSLLVNFPSDRDRASDIMSALDIALIKDSLGLSDAQLDLFLKGGVLLGDTALLGKYASGRLLNPEEFRANIIKLQLISSKQYNTELLKKTAIENQVKAVKLSGIDKDVRAKIEKIRDSGTAGAKAAKIILDSIVKGDVNLAQSAFDDAVNNLSIQNVAGKSQYTALKLKKTNGELDLTKLKMLNNLLDSNPDNDALAKKHFAGNLKLVKELIEDIKTLKLNFAIDINNKGGSEQGLLLKIYNLLKSFFDDLKRKLSLGSK